ncbi:MAG: metallophosphoesterase family protein, partial [Candidatus Aenigmarchaeota archaeon]|nr:serine/threonine protein phosphatase [Candidatus Aenigmarchaeota archaeon]MDW8149620.1 metallophosphoesterase family protein [Candidatus Aenigmarchaeota archaeon]
MKFERNHKLIEIECERAIVVGDIHGDYTTFSKVKNFIDKYFVVIFLGDYADRGEFGIEIIEEVYELTKKQNVVALKGNHEDYSENGFPNFSPCDLIREAEIKKKSWKQYFHNFFKNFIDSLYLAAILNEKYLLIHGGISSKIKSKKDLSHPTKEIEEDVLWSDPYNGDGEYPNPRGAGVLFGKNITDTICKILGIEKIIRSHEPIKAINGVFYEHNEKVLTINSTT